MKTRTVTTYEAEDGKLFSTKEACKEYENSLKNLPNKMQSVREWFKRRGYYVYFRKIEDRK